MATFLGLLYTFLALLAASNTSPVTAIEEFKVGDSEGWRQPAVNETQLYNHWASKRRFHVGDSLRFEYENDTVVVVEKWGYYHCNTSNAMSVFNDGNTLVNLDKAGPIYFISGDPDHCKGGQRLVIEVISLHPKWHAPPPAMSMSPAPSPHSSSATSVSVSVATLSVLVALIVSLVGLVWSSLVLG